MCKEWVLVLKLSRILLKSLLAGQSHKTIISFSLATTLSGFRVIHIQLLPELIIAAMFVFKCYDLPLRQGN